MPGAEAGDPGGEGAVHVSVTGLGGCMWRWGGALRTKGNKKHKADFRLHRLKVRPSTGTRKAWKIFYNKGHLCEVVSAD